MWLPTDCAFSVLSTSCGLNAEQWGFGFPAPGAPRQRRSNVFAPCGNDPPIQTGNGNFVTGFRDCMPRFRVELRIRFLEKLVYGRCRLNVLAMVDEFLYGYA